MFNQCLFCKKTLKIKAFYFNCACGWFYSEITENIIQCIRHFEVAHFILEINNFKNLNDGNFVLIIYDASWTNYQLIRLSNNFVEEIESYLLFL